MQKPDSIAVFYRAVLLILLASILSACSFPGVYKINVQQGNIVTQDMLDQLKPGMTRQQVYFVLGKPVAQNVFDTSFDTYYYSFQEAGGETESQTITVHYEGDGLFERYEGNMLDEHPAY